MLGFLTLFCFATKAKCCLKVNKQDVMNQNISFTQDLSILLFMKWLRLAKVLTSFHVLQYLNAV